MNTIFISHSSKDSAAAEEIIHRLDAQGHQSVFLDFDPEFGIPPGRNWEHELYKQLRDCHAVIVLCSEYSMSSRWCFAEITHAKSLGKHLFPVKIGPCSIDPVLTSRQILDLTDKKEDAYQMLWRGLKLAGLDPADSFDWDFSRSPYPGMMAFQEKDAAVFFGREAEIQQGLEILQRLKQFGGARMLLVLGASGIGKSSVVLSGLLPRLRRNKEQWLIIDPFRPQEDPIRELSVVLSEAYLECRQKRGIEEICKQLILSTDAEQSQNQSILNDIVLDLQISQKQRDSTTILVIDQAEELLVRSDKERSEYFLSLLCNALEASDSHLMVIFTLRSDFLAEFQRQTTLMGLSREHLSIGPMASENISKIIEGPAKIARVEIEDGLVQIMIRDTEKQEALPLLAYTLRELYEKYGDDKLFEIDEYQNKLGGLNGAVSKAADVVYSAVQLSNEYEKSLRTAFISLVSINKDGQYTRQPAKWSALPECVHDVLERFVKARLLSSRGKGDDRLLEVAHEALFDSWERLRRWLDANREFLFWRERYRERLLEWQRVGGSDPQTLLSGSALHEARSWKERYGDQFTPEDNEYLCKSDLQAKRLRNRKYRVVSGLIVFLITVAIGGGFLWQRAEKQKVIAIEQLVKNYLSDAFYAKQNQIWLKFLHFTAKAGKFANSNPHVKNSIYNINNHMTIFLSAILKDDGYLKGSLFIKNETRILTWSDDGTARLWDATQGSPIGKPMKHDKAIWRPLFNKDETRILTWSDDGTARLWSAIDGSPIGTPMIHDKAVRSAVFNNNETRILTWSDDGTARSWSAVNGSPIGNPMKHDKAVRGAVFNNDETRILTWSDDGTARLWSAINGSPIGNPMKHDKAVRDAQFNKDESRILTWSDDSTARLWSAIDGSSIGKPMKHDKPVRDAQFNKDESRILTWSDDSTARLWSAIDGSSIGKPMKHDKPVRGAVFSNDESRILTWSDDGTARLWDAADGLPIGLTMKYSKTVYGATFNEDDTRILTWGTEGMARLWDATNGSPIGLPMQHDGYAVVAVFNNDESRILTWGIEGMARLWDATNGSPIGKPMKHDEAIWGALFNKDETRILTWSDDGTARLWDAADGSPVGQPMKHDETVRSAMFNKDETRILTWSDDGTARLWIVTDDSAIGQPMKHDDFLNGPEVNKDKTRLLTWSSDLLSGTIGTVRLWNATDGSPIGKPMKHDEAIWGALFNKDETRILTWGGDVLGRTDGTVRLWNATDGSPIGKPMIHDKAVTGALFNKDETRILTWSDDGTARLWDASEGSPIVQPMQHNENVRSAMFNKDETRILTSSDDGTARLWDATNGSPIGRSMKHELSVKSAMFSKDDTRILTRSSDTLSDAYCTVRLWDATNGSPIGQPMKHDRYVKNAVFNKDETRILTWSDDGTARLWSAIDGSPIGTPMIHDKAVTGALFNKDETRILTWSGDGTARLWDASEGSPIGQPMKHDESVWGALFNKDETRILTSSDDGTARLWDATNGSPIGQPMKHDESVWGAAFNNDETWILTWSGGLASDAEGMVLLWNATDGSPIGQPMKHSKAVYGAVFNNEETRILTWSIYGPVRLWDIEVDEDFPKKHLPLMVKVTTGTVIDDYDNVTALSKKKWEEYRAEYIRIAKEHLKHCKHKSANIYLNYQKPYWSDNMTGSDKQNVSQKQ